jgi:hypothetical protein
MKDLIELVRSYSEKIENGRDSGYIFEGLREEVDELEAEVFGYDAGPDGIPGEAVDVILCALDLIFKSTPEWTNEDIVAYAEKKCEKWARKYS